MQVESDEPRISNCTTMWCHSMLFLSEISTGHIPMQQLFNLTNQCYCWKQLHSSFFVMGVKFEHVVHFEYFNLTNQCCCRKQFSQQFSILHLSNYWACFQPFVMAALCNRAGHYILPCGFFYLLLFSSPNLSGRRLAVYHTSGLKCTARSLLEIQDPKNRQKFAISALLHNFVGLYLHN